MQIGVLIILASLMIQSCHNSQLFSVQDKDQPPAEASDLTDMGTVHEPVMVGGSFLVCGHVKDSGQSPEYSSFGCRIEDHDGHKDEGLIPNNDDIIATHGPIVL